MQLTFVIFKWLVFGCINNRIQDRKYVFYSLILQSSILRIVSGIIKIVLILDLFSLAFDVTHYFSSILIQWFLINTLSQKELPVCSFFNSSILNLELISPIMREVFYSLFSILLLMIFHLLFSDFVHILLAFSFLIVSFKN